MNRMLTIAVMVAAGTLGLLVGCSSDSSGGAQPAETGGSGGTMNGGSAGSAGQSMGGAAGSAGQSMGGAAGTSGTAGTGNGGSAGSAGASGGQAFSPSGVTYTYTGSGSNAGLSIVAGTIEPNGSYGPEWLIAVRNDGTAPVCIVSIPADFLDASSAKLAHVIVDINSAMYTSYDSPTGCLGPGETGMGEAAVTFTSGDVTKVKLVQYGISGAIDPAATKLPDMTADGITVADFSSTMKLIKGKLTNHSSSKSYKFPGLTLYTVDGAGRPLAQGAALSSTDLAPGGTWDFTMYVRPPVDKYVTYVEGD